MTTAWMVSNWREHLDDVFCNSPSVVQLGTKEGRIMPGHWLGYSALCSLRCYYTDGWVSGRTSSGRDEEEDLTGTGWSRFRWKTAIIKTENVIPDKGIWVTVDITVISVWFGIREVYVWIMLDLRLHLIGGAKTGPSAMCQIFYKVV